MLPGKVTVEDGVAVLIEDAKIHAPCMQIDAAIKSMGLAVETHGMVSFKQSHCFYVSVVGVMVPEEVSPGTYTVHGSFTYGKDTVKSTRAYTFKIP
jgi:hypothetical protein